MTGVQQATRRSEALDLAGYRRRVHELYARVRELGSGSTDAFRLYRETRDRLLAQHPRSPLDAASRRSFAGLPYYPYDPGLRFVLRLDPDVETETIEIRLRDDGAVRLQRIGTVRFTLEEEPASLSVFWIAGYGGGLFLPFRDATSGATTYGGGRYLLDTIKGADLGEEGGSLVIDFNYAYNPSCAYSAAWECPLAPHENTLRLAVRAGERSPEP